MNTILITGVEGFLGSNASLYFSKKGWNVIGLSKSNINNKIIENIGLSEFYEGQLTFELLNKIKTNLDLVFHCAGGSSVGLAQENPILDYEKTVTSVYTLLNYISFIHPNARIIYPSSAAVYGNTMLEKINESEPLKYFSNYGLHKKLAEDILCFYSKHYNIDIKIIRFFSIYGEGLRKQLLWDTCQKIKNRNYSFSGSGYEKRDWIYINDAVELVHLISNLSSKDFEVFNGGTGIGHATSYVIKKIFKLFCVTNEPYFSGEKKEGDPDKLVADVTKIKKYNWFPHTSLDSGIEYFVHWFKKNIK